QASFPSAPPSAADPQQETASTATNVDGPPVAPPSLTETEPLPSSVEGGPSTEEVPADAKQEEITAAQPQVEPSLAQPTNGENNKETEAEATAQTSIKPTQPARKHKGHLHHRRH